MARRRKQDAARTLGLGFSPCPNDTFQFHALVHGLVEVEDVRLEPTLLDIEELNRRALRKGVGGVSGRVSGVGGASGDAAKSLEKQRPLFVTKLSIPALTHLTNDYTALAAGAALGRGCGPMVVRNVYRGDVAVLEDLYGMRVAVPGEHTTAAMLLQIFGPKHVTQVPMPFDGIMPAVADGKVDAGVIIHEGRFTYKEHGMILVADLGQAWEEKTDLPLPLAVIAARRDLGNELIGRIEDGIRRSVEHAMAHPDDSREYVRQHAQEMDEAVCRQHIELYVNDYSKDLGETGRAAVEEMIKGGRAVGVVPKRGSPWR